jgi:hypothetical protein
MKKLFVSGIIALLSVMMVLQFTACPTDGGSSKKSDLAVMTSFTVKATVKGEEKEVQGDLGTAITNAEWASLNGKAGLTETQLVSKDLEFGETASLTFTAVGLSKKATVKYAVKSDDTLPKDNDFTDLSVTSGNLLTGDTVYFKVVSESGKIVNYYGVTLAGLGQARSNSVLIRNFKIGDDSTSINPGVAQAKPTIAELTLTEYVVLSKYTAGDVTLNLERQNSDQIISWAKVIDTAPPPADNDFTEFTQPATGNNLSVKVSTSGLKNGDKIYIKVISADKSSTVYYGFKADIGNVAKLASLTIGGQDVDALGTPGTAWNAAELVAGTFDFQDPLPTSGFTLVATAEDMGKIAYQLLEVNQASQQPNNFTDLPATPPSLTLATGKVLYIRVTSVSDTKTVYYKLGVILKQRIDVLYGQPTINLGTNGGAPTLDPLWATLNTWDFDVSRVNLAEMSPLASFNATTSGKGHTEGKAKAFWDDYGLYIYAEMSFNALTTGERKTSLSPAVAGLGDDNAHLRDSLEIFTNERVQQYKEGNYGIQYRVAPSPETDAETNSRISGNAGTGAPTGGDAPIAALRESKKYYSWIRKDNAGKEQGYSIIAYIPWVFKTNENANQVFDTTGKVRTNGNDAGPTVGVELQLNVVNDPLTNREAILTWNGVTGQSYQQARNYGNAVLITGNLGQRGIVRGAKDPVYQEFTITFDPGTGGTVEPTTKKVTSNTPLGTLPVPTKADGSIFQSWADSTGKIYTAESRMPESNLTLIAQWAGRTNVKSILKAGEVLIAGPDVILGGYDGLSVPTNLPDNEDMTKYNRVTVTIKFFDDDGTLITPAHPTLGTRGLGSVCLFTPWKGYDVADFPAYASSPPADYGRLQTIEGATMSAAAYQGVTVPLNLHGTGQYANRVPKGFRVEIPPTSGWTTGDPTPIHKFEIVSVELWYEAPVVQDIEVDLTGETLEADETVVLKSYDGLSVPTKLASTVDMSKYSKVTIKAEFYDAQGVLITPDNTTVVGGTTLGTGKLADGTLFTPWSGYTANDFPAYESSPPANYGRLQGINLTAAAKDGITVPLNLYGTGANANRVPQGFRIEVSPHTGYDGATPPAVYHFKIVSIKFHN